MCNITIYENLANAIILQAVKDYRMALKSLKANSRNRTAQADSISPQSTHHLITIYHTDEFYKDNQMRCKLMT